MGYLEVTYAIQGKVQHGVVQNSSGVFAQANDASITAAAAALAKDMPEDFRASITNAPAAERRHRSIASFTWLLVPAMRRGQLKKQSNRQDSCGGC